ncbi:MAG: hypothetical protein EZS28_009426 [Streblomastix strix]|uniref:Uncharacterized protein n=1 Tax=Streblomastix strix TaxID=222440 RepID=A0A5J4WJE8_9EUKA|nr:MAG: hypothetical protein EZS28_009426 [Streblomastix strix]
MSRFKAFHTEQTERSSFINSNSVLTEFSPQTASQGNENFNDTSLRANMFPLQQQLTEPFKGMKHYQSDRGQLFARDKSPTRSSTIPQNLRIDNVANLSQQNEQKGIYISPKKENKRQFLNQIGDTQSSASIQIRRQGMMNNQNVGINNSDQRQINNHFNTKFSVFSLPVQFGSQATLLENQPVEFQHSQTVETLVPVDQKGQIIPNSNQRKLPTLDEIGGGDQSFKWKNDEQGNDIKNYNQGQMLYSSYNAIPNQRGQTILQSNSAQDRNAPHLMQNRQLVNAQKGIRMHQLQIQQRAEEDEDDEEDEEEEIETKISKSSKQGDREKRLIKEKQHREKHHHKKHHNRSVHHSVKSKNHTHKHQIAETKSDQNQIVHVEQKQQSSSTSQLVSPTKQHNTLMISDGKDTHMTGPQVQSASSLPPHSPKGAFSDVLGEATFTSLPPHTQEKEQNETKEDSNIKATKQHHTHERQHHGSHDMKKHHRHVHHSRSQKEKTIKQKITQENGSSPQAHTSSSEGDSKQTHSTNLRSSTSPQSTSPTSGGNRNIIQRNNSLAKIIQVESSDSLTSSTQTSSVTAGSHTGGLGKKQSNSEQSSNSVSVSYKSSESSYSYSQSYSASQSSYSTSGSNSFSSHSSPSRLSSDHSPRSTPLNKRSLQKHPLRTQRSEEIRDGINDDGKESSYTLPTYDPTSQEQHLKAYTQTQNIGSTSSLPVTDKPNSIILRKKTKKTLSQFSPPTNQYEQSQHSNSRGTLLSGPEGSVASSGLSIITGSSETSNSKNSHSISASMSLSSSSSNKGRNSTSDSSKSVSSYTISGSSSYTSGSRWSQSQSNSDMTIATISTIQSSTSNSHSVQSRNSANSASSSQSATSGSQTISSQSSGSETQVSKISTSSGTIGAGSEGTSSDNSSRGAGSSSTGIYVTSDETDTADKSNEAKDIYLDKKSIKKGKRKKKKMEDNRRVTIATTISMQTFPNFDQTNEQ